MLFGRQSFGSAFTQGVISLGGVASATASTTADATRTRFVETENAKGLATATKPNPLRYCYIDGEVGAASAGASQPAPPAERFCVGSGGASSDAAGKLTAFFSTYTTVAIEAVVVGDARRNVRVNARGGWAAAEVEAEAFVYELFYGKPVIARAHALGTTDYVARGTGRGEATALGRITQDVGLATDALVSASAVVEELNTLGAVGFGAAVAGSRSDVSVRIDGVTRHELLAEGTCTAGLAVGNINFYTSDIANATANIAASPVQYRGVQGHGVCYGHVQGLSVVINTGMDAAAGGSAASALGAAWYTISVGGVSGVSATGSQVDAVRQETGVLARDGKASADAVGTIYQIFDVYPASATSGCEVIADAQVVKMADGLGQAMAAGEVEVVEFIVLPRAARPQAAVSAYANRTTQAVGSAVALAEILGFNQINDIQKAPGNRTHFIFASPRQHEVEGVIRLARVA